jgi:glycosyltransferase involved in cell wall biosynthesis
MTHSHPRLTRGGAEISADKLFRALKARSARTWLLGCAAPGSETRLGAPLTQPFGGDDYLYSTRVPFDYFKFANPDAQFPAVLGELIGELRPDIVHAHHYTRFGVEAFSVIKRAHPDTRIVLSLHEYLAICHNNGQMVKTADRRLCDSATLVDCAACFPVFGARDFFLRKRYIQTFMDDVDLFLTPSRFLADRYIAWGLPIDKIMVLENMSPPAGEYRPNEAPALAAAEKLFGITSGTSQRKVAAIRSGKPSTRVLPQNNPAANRKLRFGFFGQMSPLKGICVLIEAARTLHEAGIENASIHIYGDYSNQPAEYQTDVLGALADATPNVVYHGRYENADVARLMSRVDAVIVPSIWWENSPVVIQESFSCGKPVICSNIGGMAEKVRDGLDGLHFEAGRPKHLAAVLAGLAGQPEMLDRLSATVARPPDEQAALDAHLAAYARVLA